MGIKDELLKLRGKINNEISKKAGENSVNLSDKVESFLEWYYENIAKDEYTRIGAVYAVENIKNFIEKMAVWYELRYPDYEIDKLMHCSSQEKKDVNKVMFDCNSYINDFFDDKSDVRYLDWASFYNAHSFIQSLPFEERLYLARPAYDSPIYLSKSSYISHIHLTKNGFVQMAENISLGIRSKDIRNENLEGLYVEDVVKFLEDKGVDSSEYDNLKLAVKQFENWKYQKDEMLNCVMYRIIERGGDRVGPRRAFLFAKEFNRNIDIPMKYGYDSSDPGLRLFINEYIKAGGTMDLECYDNYFYRNDKELKTESIRKILSRENRFTSEEKELHQKLVDLLASQVDYDYVNSEKIKKLRIEKKYKKS